MSDHQPVEEKHKAAMHAVANELGSIFNGYGFVLLIFPADGDEGRINYASNVERKDMLTLMKEFIARNEGRFIDPGDIKQ